ncbi:hypothetical protein VKS41_007251 [Umbelopsis sp. WA50703]
MTEAKPVQIRRLESFETNNDSHSYVKTPQLLTTLPTELMVRIFIMAQNASLRMVNRRYYEISTSNLLRAHYIFWRYGPYYSLSMMATQWGIFSKPVAELLISFDCDIHADEDFIVYWASQHGHMDLCEVIFNNLKAKDDLNTAQYMLIAAGQGNIPLLELLVDEFNADPRFNEEAVLKRACLENQVTFVKKIISPPFNCNFKQNEEFVLRQSAHTGSLELVQLFISLGSDVHARGEVALMDAAHKGHYEIVKLLLERGADLHVSQESALRFAAAKNHVRIVKLLLEQQADPSAMDHKALRDATKAGHLEVTRLLLNAHADPNAGMGAALAGAALHGHVEVVKLLLERGAHIDSCGGHRAVQFAIREGHVDVVRELVKAGADLQNDETIRLLRRRGREDVLEAVSELGWQNLAGNPRPVREVG